MEGMRSLVKGACSGNLEAFGQIVQKFQNMAYGYAYSIMADFHLAEEAAQEAFIEAYQHLPSLRSPDAFPGWLRRIVFKQCDRLTRGKKVLTVPLDVAAEATSSIPGPDEQMEKQELKNSVRNAIKALPQNERVVTTLFYIDGYSQEQVAGFLNLPTTTINNRLHVARKLLKERMIKMIKKEFKNKALEKQFCSLVLNRLSKKQLKCMAGSPINKFANLLITEAFRRSKSGGLKIAFNKNKAVCMQMLEDGEWQELAPPPARVIPALLLLFAAAAKADTVPDSLQAELPFIYDGEKRVAKIKITSISLSIALPSCE